jgi:hypothetical protein
MKLLLAVRAFACFCLVLNGRRPGRCGAGAGGRRSAAPAPVRERNHCRAIRRRNHRVLHRLELGVVLPRVEEHGGMAAPLGRPEELVEQAAYRGLAVFGVDR